LNGVSLERVGKCFSTTPSYSEAETEAPAEDPEVDPLEKRSQNTQEYVFENKPFTI